MRASDVIGARVIDRKGQELGRIRDLLLEEPGPATICYALVEVAPSPGARRLTVAVPWRLIRPGPPGEPLSLKVSRDALRQMRDMARN